MFENLQKPLEEYHSVGAVPDAIGLERLEQWRDAVQPNPTLNPWETFVYGELELELQKARIEQNLKTGADINDLEAARITPMACFGLLEKNRQASCLLRIMAGIIGTSVPSQIDAVLGPVHNTLFARSRVKIYNSSLIKFAGRVVNTLKINDDTTQLANTLSAMLLINADLRMIAMPPPSRFWRYPGSDHSWNLLAWDFDQSGQLNRMRVGVVQAARLTTITPDMLNQAGYRSRHGFGVIQAFADTSKGNPAAQEFVDEQKELFMDELDRRMIETWRATMELPDCPPKEWYPLLRPEYNPIVVNRQRSEDAIKELEAEAAEDTLPPRECVTLAWLHDEYATSGLENTLGNQDFNNAIAAAKKAAEVALEQGDYTARYLALLDRRVISLHHALYNGTLSNEFLRGYVNGIAKIVEAMFRVGTDGASDYHRIVAELPTADARTIKRVCNLLYDVAGCLIASSDPQGCMVAAYGSPRQQGTLEEPGWNLNVWPRLQNGSFALDTFARVRFATDQSKSRLSHVADVPLSDLGSNGPEQPFPTILTAVQLVRSGYDSLDQTQRDHVEHILIALHDAAPYIGRM